MERGGDRGRKVERGLGREGNRCMFLLSESL